MSKLTAAAEIEFRYLNELIGKTEKSLEKAPQGTLKIEKRNGHIYYYCRLPGSDEKKVYIPKNDHALAAALAQKDYDTKLLKNLYARKKALEAFKRTYPLQTIESIYEGLCPERQKLVVPVILTDAQYIAFWLSEPYTGLSFPSSNSGGYITDNNEQVRSKSELIIANTLKRANIPYKYECPLTFGLKTIYPDFTLLDVKNRRVIYLEHFGKMDDPGYADDFVKKINFYEANKIFPGKGLLMTFESSSLPLNTTILNLLLENFLL